MLGVIGCYCFYTFFFFFFETLNFSFRKIQTHIGAAANYIDVLLYKIFMNVKYINVCIIGCTKCIDESLSFTPIIFSFLPED